MGFLVWWPKDPLSFGGWCGSFGWITWRVYALSFQPSVKQQEWEPAPPSLVLSWKRFQLQLRELPQVQGSKYLHSNPHLWPQDVSNDRMRLWIQMVEMSFFRRVCGLSCRDKVRSSGRGSEESGYSSIWRSQLRLFGHLTRIPPGHFLIEVFQVCPTRKQPHCRPRAHWRDYLSLLGNAFGSPHRMSWRSWQQEGGLGISA